MNRFLITLTLISVLVGASAAAGQSSVGKASAGKEVFTVRYIQEATYRTVHPPAGDAGDVFSTTLRLFAVNTVLGFPNNTPLGTMAFDWSFSGSSVFVCSSSSSGCKGTINLTTVTKLPGGTMTTSNQGVSLAHGLVVPITKGTGIFKGVKGTISIDPNSSSNDIYSLTLAPSSS
jgi:hypothetical protein